uniref:Uncharacterized protein n=1 Tax=Arundo donax TaxID=35708 RepID=A0A0A9D0P0_ARUDO
MPTWHDSHSISFPSVCLRRTTRVYKLGCSLDQSFGFSIFPPRT